MTDLDTLRSALHAPPQDALGALDIDQAMSAGRRLRRRRRLLAAGTVATATTAVVAVAALALNTAPVREPGPSTAQGGVTAAAPAPKPSWTPSGEVIPTGIQDDGGELVFFVTHVPETGTIGVVAARRDQSGSLTAMVINNEPPGRNDRSPGFHMTWTGDTESGHLAPTYGYYVGPATKITAKDGGRTVEARQATWSEDPQVVVFWFDSIKPGALPSDLTAYDADGRKLPAGNTRIGQG